MIQLVHARRVPVTPKPVHFSASAGWIQLSPEGTKQIDEFKRLTGLKDDKALLNNMMTFFRWGIQTSKQGRAIASVDEQAKKWSQMKLDVFEELRKTAQALKAMTAPPPTGAQGS